MQLLVSDQLWRPPQKIPPHYVTRKKIGLVRTDHGSSIWRWPQWWWCNGYKLRRIRTKMGWLQKSKFVSLV